MNNYYALLTVDTEALPKRATSSHVKRLIWGEHASGTAGVREMCAVGNEFGAKHTFFVDICGAYAYLDEMNEVVRWLDADGQDVQLHTHPEYLPPEFWTKHKYAVNPRHMNKYADDKDEFIIRYFGNLITSLTGKPLRAFRAGSFRWNAGTMRALKTVGIPLSFNNSMCAMHIGQCPYSIPTNMPFQWSNGIIEVPVTECSILPSAGKEWWARLQYPQSKFYRYRSMLTSFLPYSAPHSSPLLVFLLHSWSLLYWDKDGYGVYVDDKRIDGYRKLLKRLSKDYDIITTKEFLELLEQGKIQPTHVENLSKAEFIPPKRKKA